MTRLIIIGIFSAFFFSSTFVLNRAMSLEGGHWLWSASLRYGYMFLMLSVWLVLTGKTGVLRGVLAAYRANWPFWTVAGSTGFGLFYSLLTFGASFAPGWVVATTWQTTILATPLVLLWFGRRVPLKGVFFTFLIFIGIVLVSWEQAGAATLQETLLGMVPVLFAALAYPLGNQLIWEARHGKGGLIPRIDNPVLDNSMGRVLLMVLGSLPFWVVLTLVLQPPPPTTGQLVNTATVALLSGVIATTLFFKARHLAGTPLELSAVDATQSTEVIFSLLGEIVFLAGVWPGAAGCAGITLSLLGLIFYVTAQAKSNDVNQPDKEATWQSRKAGADGFSRTSR